MMVDKQRSTLAHLKLLHRHATCPVCRQTLVVEEGEEEGYGGVNGDSPIGEDFDGGEEGVDGESFDGGEEGVNGEGFEGGEEAGGLDEVD